MDMNKSKVLTLCLLGCAKDSNILPRGFSWRLTRALVPLRSLQVLPHKLLICMHMKIRHFKLINMQIASAPGAPIRGFNLFYGDCVRPCVFDSSSSTFALSNPRPAIAALKYTNLYLRNLNKNRKIPIMKKNQLNFETFFSALFVTLE